MMKFNLLLVSLCLPASLLNAQDKSFRRCEFQFTMGVNSHQAVEIEPDFSLMLNRYVGFTAGLNFMNQMYDNTHYYRSGAHYWIIAENSRKAMALLFRPALRLRFPVFREGGEYFIYFNLEPGAFINLTPNSALKFDLIADDDPLSYVFPLDSKRVTNKGGQVFFYHVKGYFSIDFDRWTASAGFAYSDFDIYSGWRNIKIEGLPVNDMIWSRRTTRTLFASLSYCF
ncbi:MAG: hypothetical protein LBJ47_08685 [Tannerella sp.]|jgi:hypothetical protein|nr:hypothetical protein [Tannerella sp.]